MKKLTATRGLPSSGKSSWAREQGAKDVNTVLVSKDDLRRTLFPGQGYSKDREVVVCAARDAIVAEALSRNHNVICHDTNGHPKHLEVLSDLAQDFDAEFRVEDFTHVPVETCVERDAKRDETEQVGANVIWGMYKRDFAPPKPGVDDLVTDKRRWFTSDLHFGHVNCAMWRGWTHATDGTPNVNEMNQTLVANWNDLVNSDDDVFVLGDAVLGIRDENLPLIGKLNGHKFLVPGNHDHCHPMYGQHSLWWPRYAKYFTMLPVECTVKIAGRTVLLNHFPYGELDHTTEARYPEWRPKDTGLWLLHGHTHSEDKFEGVRMINVGLDAWDYRPVQDSEIADILVSGDGATTGVKRFRRNR